MVRFTHPTLLRVGSFIGRDDRRVTHGPACGRLSERIDRMHANGAHPERAPGFRACHVG